MLTLNQAVGNNSDTIWVIKINTSTPIYISTRDLALDTTFDGKALSFDSPIGNISFNSSIKEGGGTGSVTSFGFSISRYVDNTSLDGFFNEFYPATSGVYLSSQIVQLGVCWVGADADSDITWLFRGRIVDCQYEQRRLNITVFQESEITNKEVPYYSVQKDFDNGISYYTDAPEDTYGKTIPIVYGDLAQTSLPPYVRRFTPIIRVGENKYPISSHRNYNPYGGSSDDRLFEEVSV